MMSERAKDQQLWVGGTLHMVYVSNRWRQDGPVYGYATIEGVAHRVKHNPILNAWEIDADTHQAIIGAIDAATEMTPERLAHLFHETYERLAPSFGYATRNETAIPWLDIPEDNPNKRLMIAVAAEVLKHLGMLEG